MTIETRINRRGHESPASIVGGLRDHAGEGEGELRRMSRLEVRFAPIAWLFGLGFVGYGLDGFGGAGIALMIPATLVFVGALLDPADFSPSGRRRKKTLRHRWFLWLDRLDRKRDRVRYERRERKEAERRFLDSRRERKGR